MNWIDLRKKILSDMPCMCITEWEQKLWIDGVDTAISFIKDELTNQQIQTITKGTSNEMDINRTIDSINNQRI